MYIWFKTRYMKQSFTIVTFFISVICCSQFNATPIKNWKSNPVPVNEDTLAAYNNDTQDWTVFLKENEIFAYSERKKVSDTLPFTIIPTEEERFELSGRRSVIQVDDGFLVGFYRGEWGGDLYWFSKDGKEKYEIPGGEIVQFIKRDSSIYAIQGLAHLGLSYGSIINIKKVSKKWVAAEYLKLPFAPGGIDIDSHNNFVIITSESLLSVGLNLKIHTLIEHGIWTRGLYPTSLVIKDNIAYIGMRKGVFKYYLSTGEQEWLMKY